MRKVIAGRIFKRQFDMTQLRIVCNVHRQTRAGKMFCRCKADIMLNNRRFRAFRQRQMVAIMRGVQLVAIHALRDMH